MQLKSPSGISFGEGGSLNPENREDQITNQNRVGDSNLKEPCGCLGRSHSTNVDVAEMLGSVSISHRVLSCHANSGHTK